ncbi:MAG: glycosyltransferase family 2 protein [Bacteroidota bacterium]|nr:glycosyltransferase family 2 protein [Bacteroidota bacterium]
MIISIITPTYNSERTIATNVESVLLQKFTDFEHIIIDNKSTDKTLSIIEALYRKAEKTNNLRIISEPDKGISDAFNKGIRNAHGEIIGILNSDDYYYDESVLKRTLEAFSDRAIIFTHGDMFFEDPLYGSNIRRPLLCPAHIAMPFNHPTMFFRREVYENYGLFDLSFKYAMDYELICRLEKEVPDFMKKGAYLRGKPLVYVKSGGASWEHEEKAIKEIKPALVKNGLWTFEAKKAYCFRRSRNIIKKYIEALGLKVLIQYWRNWKWGNSK